MKLLNDNRGNGETIAVTVGIILLLILGFIFFIYGLPKMQVYFGPESNTLGDPAPAPSADDLNKIEPDTTNDFPDDPTDDTNLID